MGGALDAATYEGVRVGVESRRSTAASYAGWSLSPTRGGYCIARSVDSILLQFIF